jgi:hypothetical protein
MACSRSVVCEYGQNRRTTTIGSTALTQAFSRGGYQSLQFLWPFSPLYRCGP